VSYGLLILRHAARQLAALPPETYPEALNGIRQLAADPLPTNARKLVNREGWHLRLGEFRVIYEVNLPAARVTVLDISRRSDV